jgi:hypothetical protein
LLESGNHQAKAMEPPAQLNMRIVVASEGVTIMTLWLVVRRRKKSRSKLIDLYVQADRSSASARHWSGQAIGRQRDPSKS